MTSMQELKEERMKLQSERKLFEQKQCSKCTIDLSLPTFYFMCGHVFHESCVQEKDGQKVCIICYPEMRTKLSIQAQELNQLQAEFDNELHGQEKKMDTIAKFFGRGLFTEMQKEMSMMNI